MFNNTTECQLFYLEYVKLMARSLTMTVNRITYLSILIVFDKYLILDKAYIVSVEWVKKLESLIFGC